MTTQPHFNKYFIIMETFIRLVKDMRNAQKEYFRTRSHSALYLSMSLERRVDNEIEKLEESLPKQQVIPF